MPIEDRLNNEAAERETLASGMRWLRFLFLFFALFILFGLITERTNILLNLILFVVCGLLFIFFHRRRILKYDDENIYIVRDANEKVIPLSSIISVKKSSTKVNGRRYYIILYKDEFNAEHKHRFFPGTFFGGIKDFETKLRNKNPGVVIWHHPFFNH